MIPKTFTPQLESRDRAMTRSRGLRGRSVAALCLIGLLGAAACSDSEEGATDGERAVRSNTPTENSGTTERAGSGAAATPRQANPEGVDTDDINAIEGQDTDEVDGINGGGRRSGAGSSSGGRRRNADDDQLSDAGLEDGGVVDEDGGVVEVDAGEVEVDAGDVAVDAGDAG
jgi:hypothetical protein